MKKSLKLETIVVSQPDRNGLVTVVEASQPSLIHNHFRAVILNKSGEKGRLSNGLSSASPQTRYLVFQQRQGGGTPFAHSVH